MWSWEPREPRFFGALACQLHITDNFTLGAREESMGEGAASAAAVQVDNASALAAGEDDPLIEGVVALGVDEAGALQEIEGIALGEEVTPQASAGGITDLQLFD